MPTASSLINTQEAFAPAPIVMDDATTVARRAPYRSHSSLFGTATELRRDQQSPSPFRHWFGNSTIRDSAGRPLEVFHATERTFTSFRTHGSYEQGFRLDAAFFAETAMAASEFCGGSSRCRIIAAFLRLDRPRLAIMDNSIDAPNAWRNPIAEQAVIMNARARSCDGVIFCNATTGERYFCAFEADQIWQNPSLSPSR